MATVTTKNNASNTTTLHPAVVEKVNEVKTKIATNNGDLTTDDLTTGVANSRHLLFNFLMDNNLPNLNVTLKNDIDEPVDLSPNRTQIETIIAGYILKNEMGKLNLLIQNFKFNAQAKNYTMNKEVLTKLLQKIQ